MSTYETSYASALNLNDDGTFTVLAVAESTSVATDSVDDGVLKPGEAVTVDTDINTNQIQADIEGIYGDGYVVFADGGYVLFSNTVYTEGFSFETETDPEQTPGIPICYLKGTRIGTPNGESTIESLQEGDEILTAGGEVKKVKWVGFRKFNRFRIPNSRKLNTFPIRILKDAFAPNVPHRDLAVSPGHRFNVDGALVPALSLVNGQTITQDFEVQQFEYYHVELEKFDMLLAEGAVAESYLEVGDNRRSFENAETVAAHPDFGPAPARVVLPQYVQKITPEIIQPIRRELFKRAEVVMGAVRTSDANLQIEINGQLIRPQTTCTKKGVYRFELPAGLSGDIHILSNSAVTRETALLNRTDTRIIGVGLAAMTLAINGERRDIDLNEASLTGFNDVQEMDGVAMRWTTGAAVIPASLLPSSSTPAVLELDVLRTHMYWQHGEQQHARIAA